MWVKTRQEVVLGIELSILTHTLIVTQPSVATAVIGIDEDGSIDGFSVNGVDAELPAAVVPHLPKLREMLVGTGMEMPAHIVFSRVQGDISVKVHQNSIVPAI